MDLFKLKDMVLDTLVGYPNTRESDEVLTYVIYHNYYGISNEPFWEVMTNRKEMGLPSMESIGRARRKIVEKHPELKGCEKIEQMRFDMQKDYIEFAMEG